MQLTRRATLAGLGAALSLPWVRPSYAAAGSVNIYSWAEYIGETTLADFEAETRGGQLDRLNLNKLIFPKWDASDIEKFMLLSDELFVEYPPFNHLPPSFINTAIQAGYTIYISSNTVFTSGAALSRVIYDRFVIPKSNCKFSDEIGKAKIDASMFDFEIKPTFHIGDNPKTDGASELYGIEFLDVTTLSLPELIKKITHD